MVSYGLSEITFEERPERWKWDGQVKHMGRGGGLWGQGKVGVGEEQQSKGPKAGKVYGVQGPKEQRDHLA